jgi:hypothetical protein
LSLTGDALQRPGFQAKKLSFACNALYFRASD